MYLQAYFSYTCGHNSQLFVRPCSEPHTCGLNGQLDIVRIPWLSQSFCDGCFAPNNNVNPIFSGYIELLPELHAQAKVISNALRDHHANHGPHSPFYLNPNELDLFAELESQNIEEIHRISRLLVLNIQADAQRSPPKLHTLEEKRLVIQLRRAVQKNVLDAFETLPRSTTLVLNERFLALSSTDRNRVFRQAMARMSVSQGFDANGEELVMAPCRCLITRSELDSRVLSREEVRHYEYRWLSQCADCSGVMVALEATAPVVNPASVPWFLPMLLGVNKIPNGAGKPDSAGRPGLMRRMTAQLEKSSSKIARKASNLSRLTSRKSHKGGK